MGEKKCGLLGEKLSHSFSPQIHRLLADYEYSLFPTPSEKVEEFITKGDWYGINVTVPYKEKVIPYLDCISPEAKKIGAVNTVVRDKDNRLCGYNTDFYGFSYLVDFCGFDVKGKKCIILGSGGSSKTVFNVLQAKEAGEIVVISRRGENNYDNINIHSDAGIIVNTTPVGMYPENYQKLIELRDFPQCRGVIDLIYNPEKTPLLLDAEKLGIKHSNGLLMLVAQAKAASEIFTGEKISDTAIHTILSGLRREMLNVVLVGMAGCGKSTVGKILAEKTNREFLDTDDIISQNGKTPAEIITTKGEAEFRKIETEVVRQTGKQRGKIIATGGGVVTVKENYPPLHQNGIIIFINRSPKLMTSENRPLSEKYGVENLYNSRLPMYREFCDRETDGDKTPQEVAQDILDILKTIM
ncbi:MAG: shikimate kinase [Clostridia bacterium]|nr:shikimate kinase [Clostridia bacterium]